MGAQWKAKGKAAAADARGKLFGRWPRTSWWPRAMAQTRRLNARLRLVVEQARKVSMPKDTLERAIKKGAGLTAARRSLRACHLRRLCAAPGGR
jgi:transcriptional/translational regulatory protein YebC/TACO1